MPRDKMNKHDTTSGHHILVGESKIQKKIIKINSLRNRTRNQ